MAICQGKDCNRVLEPSTRRERKYCSERCRKTQYSTPCEDCGAPTNGSNGRGPKAPTRCRSCDVRRNRAAGAEHKATVERLWAEGLSAKEIAKRLGWLGKNPGAQLSTLRSRGYDLPHRYSPERCERMAVGAADRMALARAMYAEQKAAA